jgi:hypothetical protein
MKGIFVLMLAAVGLLASDHSGVRPRAAKDYPAYGSAEGFTIAAAVVPGSKVKHQLSPDMVKAGYNVLEIACLSGCRETGRRLCRRLYDEGWVGFECS